MPIASVDMSKRNKKKRMAETTLDIQDRQQSLDTLNELIQRAELGIRAVSVMYNEHSDDQFTIDNIFRLKDNIFYRVVINLCSRGIVSLLIKVLLTKFQKVNVKYSI